MKKILVDKKYMKICLYVLFIIVVSILFEKLIENIGGIVDTIVTCAESIIRVLSPFIYGAFIAYFINVPARWIEMSLCSRIKLLNRHPKSKRILSVLTSYAIILSLLIWCIAYLIPHIVENLNNLVSSLQAMGINKTQTATDTGEMLNSFFISFNDIFSTNYQLNDFLNLILDPITSTLSSLPGIFNTIWAGTVKVASTLTNVIFGLVIGFYMLFEKENMISVAEKFLYVIFNRSTSKKIIILAKNSNIVFQKFLIGKMFASAIIGYLFFFAGFFFDLPFLLISSLITGIANMIPYFGPAVGAVLVVSITLLVKDPISAFWALVIIIVLQQLDNWIVTPKILGDSIGVKPIGVIFSIIVGGSLFGFVGMLFGVPVFVVLEEMFSTILNRKYNEKYTAAGLKNTQEKY